MLGIGIFLAPAEVAKHLPSPVAFLAMWCFGGLVSLAGAVACAELGAMFPEAGGDYVFQYKAFGSSVASNRPAVTTFLMTDDGMCLM